MAMNEPEGTDRAEAPGALIGKLALALGGLWTIGSAVVAVAVIGPANLHSLSTAEWAAVAAAVMLPAMMSVFSGMAASDSARARAEARRLADAADRLMNPERSAEEAARQVARTVRGEISQLDQALEHTLARLQEVENQISRQAQAVDQMSDQAKAGANQMIMGMEREREELLKISRDLNNQAQAIGGSISKHTQSISEAARQAELEVRAADQALDHRLTSFGAAAALISDRTQGLSTAAQASADSALRLETALSNALEVLSKATGLTDAARQSADAAALAANSTAGAVQDATARAVDDARRAAQLIREEAASVEQEAASALDRLREAAEAARSAAIEARSAVEQVHRDAPAPRRGRSQPRQEARDPRYDQQYDESWRDEPDPLDAAPPPRGRRGQSPRDEAMFGDRGERPNRPDPDRQGGGSWTWRDLLSGMDGAPAPAQRRSEPTADPVGHLRRQPAHAREASLPIAETIDHAGLQLDDVFSPSALERIAQRARSGTQARRRAVCDAAPGATARLADFLAQDSQASQEAMQFLRHEGARIAELLARGRAAMNAEATLAFLLIDASIGA